MDEDIDLELEPVKRPPKSAPAAKAAVGPTKAAQQGAAQQGAAQSEAAPGAAAEAEAAAPAAKALPRRKRGPLGNLWAGITGPLQSLRMPELNARSFGWGLLVIVILWQISANWSPVRISILGLWHFDIPKALAFIIDVAIGVALVLLWQRCMAARKAVSESAGSAKPE